MAKDLSKLRGIRNNNPGNIDYAIGTKWQGLAAEPLEPTPLDGGRRRFAVFKDAPYGIRAIARTLITYSDKDKCDTIYTIVSRWAPPSDNNNDTAYAAALAVDVSTSLGRSVSISEKLDLHDYKVLRPLVCGIIEHENGLSSYTEAYTDAQIDKGLTLAGVEAPKQALPATRTVSSAIVTGAVTIAGTALDSADSIHDALMPFTDVKWIHYVVMGCVLLGLARIIWVKHDERKKGIS